MVSLAILGMAPIHNAILNSCVQDAAARLAFAAPIAFHRGATNLGDSFVAARNGLAPESNLIG